MVDNSGINNINFTFNEMLFKNMAFYSDAVWAIDIESQTITILHDKNNPEVVGKQFTLKETVEKLEAGNHPDIDEIKKRFSMEGLRSIKGIESYRQKTNYINGKYHTLQSVYTPELDEAGNTVRVFVSFLDVQPMMDIQHEADEKAFDEELSIHKKAHLEQMVDVIEESEQHISVCEEGTFKLLYANKSVRKDLGKENESYEGLTCYQYFLGQDKPCPFCPALGYDEHGNNTVEEKAFDEYFEIRVKKTKWGDANAFIEYATNITKSKNIETTLDEVADTSLATGMGRWSLLFAKGEPQLFMDNTMAELTGISKDLDPVKANEILRSRVDRKHMDAFVNYTQTLLIGEAGEVEYVFHHPSKGEMYVRCFGKRDSNYTGPGIMIRGYHQDITEQYISKRLLDLSMMVTEALTRDYGNVYLVNPESKTLEPLKESEYTISKVAYESQNVISYDRAWSEFLANDIHPDDRLEATKATVMEHVLNKLDEQGEFEFTFRSQSFGEHYIQTIFRKLKDGRIINAFRIIDDIMMREAEHRELLRQALDSAEEANRAKTVFLNNMSHDIRTPMNAIRGMTNIARDNVDKKEKLIECFDKIDVASGHLLSLINEVLDVSKLESGAMVIPKEPVDILSIIEECLTIIEPQAGEMDVEVNVHGINDLNNHYVISSALHLSQIFINLASNGIKYNKPGGNIDIYVEEKMFGTNQVTYTFTFKDNGIGMEPAFIKKMFEPFAQEQADSRTKYKGTGLGLSIVKLIVEQMGGDIDISSVKGEGSTFLITIPFPIDASKRKETGEARNVAGIDMTNRKVLIVEDNDLNMEIAKYIMTEAGAIVSEASDGQMAVDMVAKADGQFELILMDIMMPVMDGYEATRIIREKGYGVPIIAMTANAFAEDRKKALECGMNAHVPKPIDVQYMMATISEIINS